ncbi:hypothetical protein TRVL_05169 [Trypanosoma vivax]|nr:hypothetical protein TRVL_05169 [Trypanosoma vivax]
MCVQLHLPSTGAAVLRTATRRVCYLSTCFVTTFEPRVKVPHAWALSLRLPPTHCPNVFYTQLLSAVPDRTCSKKVCPIHPAPFTSFSFRESARCARCQCAECALSGCAPFCLRVQCDSLDCFLLRCVAWCAGCQGLIVLLVSGVAICSAY